MRGIRGRFGQENTPLIPRKTGLARRRPFWTGGYRASRALTELTRLGHPAHAISPTISISFVGACCQRSCGFSKVARVLSIFAPGRSLWSGPAWKYRPGDWPGVDGLSWLGLEDQIQKGLACEIGRNFVEKPWTGGDGFATMVLVQVAGMPHQTVLKRLQKFASSSRLQIFSCGQSHEIGAVILTTQELLRAALPRNVQGRDQRRREERGRNGKGAGKETGYEINFVPGLSWEQQGSAPALAGCRPLLTMSVPAPMDKRPPTP